MYLQENDILKVWVSTPTHGQWPCIFAAGKKASGSNIHNSEKMNEESYLDKETYKFIAIKPLDCDVYVPNIVTSNMG